MEVYNKETISQILVTNWLGKEIIYKDTIGSTNDYTKEKALNGAKQGLLVVADSQTSGKGSRKRAWLSPPQTGIWMSFLLRPNFKIIKIPEISMLIAYCIAKLLRENYDIPAMIKWPNDIVLNGKKIAGILTETGVDKDNVQYVVTGTGININMEQFTDELKDIATSILIECGHKFSRTELLTAIINQIEKEYDEYLNVNSLKNIYTSYNNMLVHRETEVRIIKGDKEITAITLGINEHGELLVQYEDGKIGNLIVGEISIRGTNNYV